MVANLPFALKPPSSIMYGACCYSGRLWRHCMGSYTLAIVPNKSDCAAISGGASIFGGSAAIYSGRAAICGRGADVFWGAAMAGTWYVLATGECEVQCPH
eukprot:1926511-Rhodomonas_salina.3